MKKNLFRIITAALILTVVFGVLASCGDQSDGQDSGDTEQGGKELYAVSYNGETVALGGDAKKVTAKIGEPASKQSTGNCGGLGETVRYDYSSFIMVVVEYESGAKIDQIEIRNDLVETAGGITIGSSESAVRSAYGEPNEVKGTTLIYKSDSCKYRFGTICRTTCTNTR